MKTMRFNAPARVVGDVLERELGDGYRVKLVRGGQVEVWAPDSAIEAEVAAKVTAHQGKPSVEAIRATEAREALTQLGRKVKRGDALTADERNGALAAILLLIVTDDNE